jgi:hypothetical protein
VEGKEELWRGWKPVKMQGIWRNDGGARDDGGDNEERARGEEAESGMGRRSLEIEARTRQNRVKAVLKSCYDHTGHNKVLAQKRGLEVQYKNFKAAPKLYTEKFTAGTNQNVGYVSA